MRPDDTIATLQPGAKPRDRLRIAGIAAAMLALLFGGATSSQARPQARIKTPRPLAFRIAAPDHPPVGPGLENGALIIHGNYCGPGDRGWGRRPIDALDAACMRHDICAPPFGTALPSCACNARLFDEAAAVASTLSTPLPVRVTATFVAQTATILPCRP